MSHFVPKYPKNDYPKVFLTCFIINNGKIILLSEENLDLLRAYKAQVIKTKKELIITLTGLSKESLEKLFSELHPLTKEEVRSK